MFRPTTLSAATNLARSQEEKIWASRKTHRTESTKVVVPSNFRINRTPFIPIKKLTAAETKERREKGLCYNCDEKYSQSDRYKVQRLYLLDGTKTEEEDLGPSLEETKIEARLQLNQEKDVQLETSLHAISGTSSPQK